MAGRGDIGKAGRGLAEVGIENDVVIGGDRAVEIHVAGIGVFDDHRVGLRDGGAVESAAHAAIDAGSMGIRNLSGAAVELRSVPPLLVAPRPMPLRMAFSTVVMLALPMSSRDW